MVFPKRRLMTPGPTQVPPPALLAMARQPINHRTDEFRTVLAEVVEGLRYVFQTQHDIILLAASGTGAMEAAVANVAPRGSKVLVLESGKFAERWTRLCETYGAVPIRYTLPWGDAFDASEVERLLRQHPDVSAVFATLLETSTGVCHDIAAIGRVVQQTPAVFVVDGISGVGAVECRTDSWGIDVLVVGSQKALMTPPGLAFAAVSSKAWRQIESHRSPSLYFDFQAYRRAWCEGDTPYTPAIPLVFALVESLRLIRCKSMEEIWARNRGLARAVRAGIAAMGFSLVASRPADGMTAAYPPAEIDAKLFLRKLESRFGVKLAGGQGPLKNRIVRIAHFGQIDEFDILGLLAAMELVLVELGREVMLGSAVAEAQRIFAAAGWGS